MFESARLKLTAWYLLIIMMISFLFSFTIYESASSEIERVINRVEFRQNHPNMNMPDKPPVGMVLREPSLKDLQNAKNKLFLTLIIINGGILIIAGGAGYFLAGRTLMPIKLMVDEQNQFISSASHELRTPIATLRAEMEGSLLEKNISDKNARALIKSNIEELDTLQELTNKLLRLAHVHAGAPQNTLEIVDIYDIVATATHKVSQLAAKKQIRLKQELVHAKISGDTHNLVELFVILLDNAIKYSEKGTTVSIKLNLTQDGVKASVADEGSGIPASDISHIFERFYRADKSRSIADGYGLGLSIAKKIVDAHKGTISVKSKEKSGTTFFVTLPKHVS